MEITLTTSIPDDTAANLHSGTTIPLPRLLLEAATIKVYETDLITEREALEIPGFEYHEELYDFTAIGRTLCRKPKRWKHRK
jgi:hypothetical protein